MSQMLRRSSRRYLVRHPWISLLSVLGVALGVAVVIAIDLSARAAQASFEHATDSITGRTTHQIVGGPTGIPEALYVELRTSMGLRDTAPVVEGSVLVTSGRGGPRRRYTLLGVDPLAEAPFRGYTSGNVTRGDSVREFLSPGTAMLTRTAAEALGLAPGDPVTVVAGAESHTLRLVELLQPTSEIQRAGLENLMLVDISTAQEVLGLYGQLSRIDLYLPGEEPPGLTAIEQRLPNGISLGRSASRSETADELTRAFRLNLFMLSLLALLCGGFLIYNSVSFSVVMRRGLFGTLRALGVTRGQLLWLVLAEAAAIGLVGSALGAFLGQLLARGLIGMVSETISNFYFAVSVSRLPLDWMSLVRGLGLGLATSILAGLRPAWEATRAAPRSAQLRSDLEAGTLRGAHLAALVGVATAALGAIFLMSIEATLWPSFVAVLAVLLGCALLTPALVELASRLLAPPLGALLGTFGRLAARGLAANLSRTGVAIAALMLALSVSIGVGLMISSFRTTVDRWLGSALPADIYLLSSEPGGGPTPPDLVRAEWLEAVAELATVDAVSRLRRVEVGSTQGPVQLVGIDMDERGEAAFALKSGDPTTIWSEFRGDSGILVSEPLAFRLDLEVGSAVELETASGRRTLAVTGVFYDYSTDRGYALMDLARYRDLWADPGLTAASVFVDRAENLESTAEAIRSLLPAGAPIIVSTQATLRQRSLEVFDRTFRITGVLRTLTLVVAIVGILAALMSQQLERTRELGMLRAAGLTRRQLWWTVTVQTGLIGCIAGLLALPVGIAMAAMTTLVINQRSFGWTIPLDIEPAILFQALAAAVISALAAGVLPALRMAATSPAEALRSE